MINFKGTPRALVSRFAALSVALQIVFLPVTVSAYTPANHELSVIQGAAQCRIEHGVDIPASAIDGIIRGVREPDDFMPSHLQMLKQRFEPNSYGTQRNIALVRIASQSFHGSPNPTRPVYGNSAEEQQLLAATIPVPPEELLADRFNLDVYAYDTNEAVRNRMLVNASQFLCVSYAHSDERQSQRKLGNLLHMVGDTYSASHVQRSEPEGDPENCGTEKIEWHFSMDLVSWKQHRPADLQVQDWRFSCLTKHTAQLMQLWHNARIDVPQSGQHQTRDRIDFHVQLAMQYLCNDVFREDDAVLQRPAGGAADGYSSASGSDSWLFLRRLIFGAPEGMAIQPIGLTSPEEAQAFHQRVAHELTERDGASRYWYPQRDDADFCGPILKDKRLPPALLCTEQEISWSNEGSDKVESLWLPSR
jgi:hypothetical protein